MGVVKVFKIAGRGCSPLPAYSALCKDYVFVAAESTFVNTDALAELNAPYASRL
jgi:hypothetical protein